MRGLTIVSRAEVLEEVRPASHNAVTLNTAVFANGPNLALVQLDLDTSESASAEVCSRGYAYAGSISVNGGTPKVHCEPGFEIIMPYAGIVFAELIGKQIQNQAMRRTSGEKVGA